MELDDFKKTWKQEENKELKTPDIMELIHQKSRGPISSLKHSFRRQMRLITVLMITITVINGRNIQSIPGYILLCTYVAFCLVMILAYYLNYRMTNRMESMDGRVKSNLENYVAQLEKRLRWQSIFPKLVALVFIILLEVLPLYQHARMIDRWHSVSPLIRFSIYGSYMVLLFFTNRKVMQRKFGQHLSHLKELLREMR